MQSNPFLETLQSHSDQKLKEMVELKRGDYQPDAIAAAEQLLRSRNVKFREAEPVEEVEMTYDEIREDIRARRQKGQSLKAIRDYYAACGVDIDIPEINRGEDQSARRPIGLRQLRLLFFIGGGLAAVGMTINEKGNSEGAMVALAILVVIAIPALYFTFRR